MPSLLNPVARLYDYATGLFAKIDDYEPLGTEQGLFTRLVGSIVGATAPDTAQVAAGIDQAGLTAAVLTDVGGSVMTRPRKRQTYSAYKHNLVAPSSATDVFTITGSASKIIRVLELRVSGYQTTAGVINLHVIKRSAANSGGTATTQTATPHDSNNAAATATVQAYSVNPTTLGAAVGTGVVDAWFSLNRSNDQNTAAQVFCFNSHGGQLPTLRGVNEVLAVNLVNQSLTGNNWCMVWTWEECDDGDEAAE